MGLRKLNLAWNGFGQDGCLALGQAMKENRTLRELDIASNRLTVEAVAGLMKGIQENDGLTVLRVNVLCCLPCFKFDKPLVVYYIMSSITTLQKIDKIHTFSRF